MKGNSNNYHKLIARVVIGVISILLIAKSMSFYDQPFGGCEKSGLNTFMSSCTSWQYFGLGLAIVFLFWVIKPKYVYLKYWGLSLVILLALIGGPLVLSNGTFLDIWDSPSIIVFYWRKDGLPLLLGGFVGIFILAVLNRWLDFNKK